MPNNPDMPVTRRYTKLNGDPLHVPLMLGFFKNADTQIVLTTVAIACGASWYMGAPDKQIGVMAFNGAAGFILYQTMDRLLFEGRRLSRHFADAARYCVDKYPTDHSMRTHPKQRISATGMRTEALLGILLMGMVTPWLYAESFTNAATAVRGPVDDLWKTGMLGCTFWLAWMAREGMNFMRFNNVLKSQWNIVFPPPKPVKKESWLTSSQPGLGS